MNKPCKYDCEYAKENKFLHQWKDEVMESFSRYDSNSVEEVYQNGVNRGIDMALGAINEVKNDL